MKLFYLITLLFGLHLQSFGQRNYLITMDQLEARVKEGKDTTYVVNFWATWCVPCIKELPGFEKLREEFKSQKIKVLLVSVDFKSSLVTSFIPFIKKHKLKNEVYLLDEENQQNFINRVDSTWSGAIPATLFIKNKTRKFYEQEFTYNEVLQTILNLK